MGRSTIHTWLKDPVFQQAMSEEKARRRSNHKGTADEAESFSEVQDIQLLSPGGIRARLELRDRLILQDLAERDTNRSVLIRLLETSIKQANDYLGKVLPDEATEDLVEQRVTKHRQAVSEVVFDLLDSLPNREWYFNQFLMQLDCIDLQNGILRDEVFKQS